MFCIVWWAETKKPADAGFFYFVEISLGREIDVSSAKNLFACLRQAKR
jgi:hypothetical protein